MRVSIEWQQSGLIVQLQQLCISTVKLKGIASEILLPHLRVDRLYLENVGRSHIEDRISQTEEDARRVEQHRVTAEAVTRRVDSDDGKWRTVHVPQLALRFVRSHQTHHPPGQSAFQRVVGWKGTVLQTLLQKIAHSLRQRSHRLQLVGLTGWHEEHFESSYEKTDRNEK